MNRKITVIAASIAVLMVAGVAFAAWTSTSSGTGAAHAGSHADLTTTGVVTASAGNDRRASEWTCQAVNLSGAIAPTLSVACSCFG